MTQVHVEYAAIVVVSMITLRWLVRLRTIREKRLRVSIYFLVFAMGCFLTALEGDIRESRVEYVLAWACGSGALLLVGLAYSIVWDLRARGRDAGK